MGADSAERDTRPGSTARHAGMGIGKQRRRIGVRLTTGLLVSTFFLPVGIAAEAQLHAVPKIGVALSGGNALGLAHIGVLRYFEEHHIPIDYIAGTSMGGLVAGFYATGMDAQQLTRLAQQADWDLLLNPNPRFIDEPAVEKQAWNRTYGDLTLRFGKGFSLPAGLNSGAALSLFLSRNTLAYSGVKNFDDLPTPFRCVATDLISGHEVVLHQGSLVQAMRATMSIPAIFTPVRMDGKVLVDGGILKVVPVEEVRAMGAQRVIAVVFESPAPNPGGLSTLPDILRRSAGVASLQNERRSLAAADLVISVNTGRFSATDYSKWREIIQAGYAAAQRQAAALKPYELSDADWQRYLQSRQARMRPAVAKGVVAAVISPSAAFQQRALAEIRRKLDDRVISDHELENVLTGMVAATAVPGAIYEWQQPPAGPEGFKVIFSERPGDQILVRPSFLFGLSPGEPSRATLRLSTTAVFAHAYKSRLLNEINAGYDPGMHTEYYHPFGGSAFFLAPALFIQRYHIDSYNGPVRLNNLRDRFGGSFYGGIGTWRFAQLRAGFQSGYDSYSSSPTVDGVKAESAAYVAPELRWIFDSQDSGSLPTRGTLSEGSAGYRFGDVDYPYFQQHFSAFRPVGRQLTLFAMNRDGASFGRKLDYFEQFTAGGESLLSAYRYQEFHANTLVTAGAGVIFHDPPIRRFSPYPGFAAWYGAGRFDFGSRGWQTHQSASAGILFRTPLGAAGLALSFNEAGKARLRLMLGSF